MVRARAAIESLYRDTCTVYKMQAVLKPNKATAYEETIFLDNQACKLSYSQAVYAQPTAASDGVVSAIDQQVKLFLAPELDIQPGSRIKVEHLGRTLYFKSSGQPALFTNHQEIRLEMVEKWA